MRIVTKLTAAICCIALWQAHADPVVESVQQALKDQGFYYGEITGQKDADTTAAIRRYQIRNGLQITGELNAETQRSLGVKGAAPVPRATPPPPAAPSVVPRPTAPPETSDLRDDAPVLDDEEGPSDNTFRPPPEAPGYAPGPRGLNPETSGLFDGTPFEVAPPDVQRRVIIGAQSLLARRGYYRSGIDGVFGPGMEFAVRAYQARFKIEQNGRLDMETLAALGLLPGQQAPGVTAPRRRVIRPAPVPSYLTPEGERIYIPR